MTTAYVEGPDDVRFCLDVAGQRVGARVELQRLGTLTGVDGEEQHAELVDLAQARRDEAMDLGVGQQGFEGSRTAQQRVHPPGPSAVEVVVAPAGAAQKAVRVPDSRGQLLFAQQGLQCDEAVFLERRRGAIVVDVHDFGHGSRILQRHRAATASGTWTATPSPAMSKPNNESVSSTTGYSGPSGRKARLA